MPVPSNTEASNPSRCRGNQLPDDIGHGSTESTSMDGDAMQYRNIGNISIMDYLHLWLHVGAGSQRQSACVVCQSALLSESAGISARWSADHARDASSCHRKTSRSLAPHTGRIPDRTALERPGLCSSAPWTCLRVVLLIKIPGSWEGRYGRRRMFPSIRSEVLLCAIAFVSAGAGGANPSPGTNWATGGLGLIQTVEFVLQDQRPTSGDSATVLILYGGPSFVYTHKPEDYEGSGVGAEAGVELRRQFSRRSSGPFVSLYAGAGALWPISESESSWIRAVSSGFKLGCRIPVENGHPSLDLEPYVALACGYSLAGDESFSGAVYLGLKLAFF